MNYLGALMLAEAAQTDPWDESSPAVQRLVEEHDHIFKTMLFLANLSTLDGWSETLKARWDLGYWLFTSLLFAIMVFNGLGVLNLIVGVMCETALSVEARLEVKERHRTNQNLKIALAKISSDMHHM